MNNLKATTLTSSSLTSNSVIITWAPPSDSSQVSSYNVLWRVNGSSSVDGNLTVGNAVSTANITGLTQGTSYVFSVVSEERGSRAITQEIESDETVTITTKAELSSTCGGLIECLDVLSECTAGETGGTVCRCESGSYDSNGFNSTGGVCRSMNNLKATTLTSSSLTSNSVIITWAPPSDSSQVSSYNVLWRVNGSSPVDGNLTVGNAVSTANITGLTQGTSYVFSVVSEERGSRAITQEIESDETVTITTKAELSSTCGGLIECLDVLSECTAGETGGTVCRCESGSYDSNGFNSTGGVCRSMNNLKATTLTSSSLTSNSVIITWAPPSDSSQVSSYNVLWRVNGSSPVDGNLTVGNAVSTANITGLTQGTSYVFSVVSEERGSRAITQEIESDETVTITTKAELSSTCGGLIECLDVLSECTAGETGGTVCRCESGSYDSNGFNSTGGVCRSMNNLKATTLTSSSLTSNSVIITWAPPSDSSQVSSYNVLWRVNGSSPVDGNLTVGNAVSTANITGLTQGTSYVFSVVSEERGSRAITQEIESDETVTITTKAELSSTCGGLIECLDVLSECTAGETGGTVCRCESGSYDSNGFNSTGGVCRSMNNLKATTLTSSSLTSNSVIITWAPPSDSSQVSSYNVLWRVNGSSPVDGNLTVGNAVSTANITGLTQGTSYVFSVVSEERGSRAITQEIESDETVTITTKAELSSTCGGLIECLDVLSECTAGETGGTVCRCESGSYDSNGFNSTGGVCRSMNNLKATTLTSSSLTSNSVIITWAPPSDSSQVSSYNVLWRVNGSSPVDGNLTVGNAVSTANITGLTQGTSYVFSVVSEERGSRAITQEIESDETVTITTKAELSSTCGGLIE
ncbi:uncharacterized protein LOC117328323 [Pecten maximus]|uniref:uncharacterized protein LOC117328323 n=1 Tax=Pecten maximus TaxID=6579 RepID=UPI001458F392|nr:uncharacterized protein LOC117328323 [Pecten maximus]